MPAAARSTCNCRCGAVQIANICEPRSLLFLRSALRSGEATPWKKSAGRRKPLHRRKNTWSHRDAWAATQEAKPSSAEAVQPVGPTPLQALLVLFTAPLGGEEFSLYVQKLYMYTVYIKNISKCIDIDSPRSRRVNTSTHVSAACTVNTQPLLAISNCIRYPSAHTRL